MILEIQFSGTSLVVQWSGQPTNAEDTGSILGSGTKTPHAKGQLSLWATTTEPMHLDPVLHNTQNHCNEKPVHHKKQ